MIWDILVKKIEDAGLGQQGQSLFVGTIPDSVTSAIMIKPPLSGVRVDPNLPDYFKPSIQLIVRDGDVSAGDAKAQALLDCLTISGEESYPATAERGGVQLKLFFPDTLPIRYPRLDGNSYEWSLNFNTAFVLHRN